MWYALISAQAELLGLFTSRTDAVLAAKQHLGCTVWGCRPNEACKYTVAQLRKAVTKFRKRLNRLPVKGYLELHAADKDVRSMMESASGKRLSFKGFMHGVDLMSGRE